MKYLSPSKVTRSYMNKKVSDALRTPTIPGHQTGTQYFGFEVEIEGRNCNNRAEALDDNLWNLARDGSLRNGVEAVFARPLTMDEANQAFNSFETAFNGFDASGMSDRTSVHAHYDVSQRTMYDLQKMITGFYMFENLLVRQAGGEARQGNRFCLRNCDSETPLKSLISGYQNGDVRSALSREREHRAARYSNLNLQALRKFGSLEVRCHKGCLDVQEFRDWLGVIDEVFTVSRTFREPREIIEKQSEMGSLRFMEEYYPLINAYTSTIQSRQDYIYDGVDYSQMLAYCVEIVAAKPKKKFPAKSDPIPRSRVRPLPVSSDNLAAVAQRLARTPRRDTISDWF